MPEWLARLLQHALLPSEDTDNMPSRTPLPPASEAVIPTRNAGEVFLPALGKVFQQVELQDHWLRFPRTHDAQGNTLDPAMPENPFRLTARLLSGDEMAVTTLLYFHPGQPAPGDVELQIGRHSPLCFPREVLKHACATHLPPGFDWNGFTAEHFPAQMHLASSNENERWVQLTRLMHKVLTLPTQGLRLTLPQQLTDSDELFVRGLDGGVLYVGGISKRALGR